MISLPYNTAVFSHRAVLTDYTIIVLKIAIHHSLPVKVEKIIS